MLFAYFFNKKKIKPRRSYRWETGAWALFLRSQSALGHLCQAHTFGIFYFILFFSSLIFMNLDLNALSKIFIQFCHLSQIII
jgi:hypothetical protein